MPGLRSQGSGCQSWESNGVGSRLTDPRQAGGRGRAPVWSAGWAGLTLAASDSCTSSSTDNARQDRLSKEPRRRRPPQGVAIAARSSSPHSLETPHSSETPPAETCSRLGSSSAQALPQVLPPRPSRHRLRRIKYEKHPPRKRFPVRRARGCAVPAQPGLRSARAPKRALSGSQPRPSRALRNKDIYPGRRSSGGSGPPVR